MAAWLNKYLIILSVAILVLVVYISWLMQRNETFTEAPMLVYNVSLNPTYIGVYGKTLTNRSDLIDDKIKMLRNIHFVDENFKGDLDMVDGKVFMTDAFTLGSNKKATDYILTNLPEKKTLLFLSPKQNQLYLSLKDVLMSSKYTIGYIDDIELSLIDKIALALDIDNVQCKFSKVPVDKETTIDQKWFDTNKVTTLCIFTCLNNTTLMNKIDNSMKKYFLDYEGLDVNKVGFLMPYATRQNIDSRLLTYNIVDEYPIKTCIGFDMLLTCDQRLFKGRARKKVEPFAREAIEKLGSFDVINYYSMYYPLTPWTLEHTSIKNQHRSIRGSLPILEQFTEEQSLQEIDIVCDDENVDGFYKAQEEVLEVFALSIKGIPLTENSRVLLNAQDREEENGLYYVVEKTSRQTTILRKYVLKQEMPSGKVYQKGDRVYDQKTKTYFIVDSNGRLVEEKKDSEDKTLDPRYECYNAPHISNRGLCESAFDEMGIPKSKMTIWDRRCEKNEECPFYQANKNYMNYQGGCINGYCQFPIGVRATSYRTYDPSTKPWCHGCKDGEGPVCCEKQKSPDYAFPLDQYERMKQM